MYENGILLSSKTRLNATVFISVKVIDEEQINISIQSKFNDGIKNHPGPSESLENVEASDFVKGYLTGLESNYKEHPKKVKEFIETLWEQIDLLGQSWTGEEKKEG